MNPNDAIDLQAIEWTSYVRFTYVENTIDNMPKVPRTKFLESDGLFSFISICKFGCFKNPFATITSLFELYFRLRRFILLVQTKKWFIWTMAAAKEAENHGNEWGLTWYFQWGIYTSIPTWTHSQNSLAAAESPSLKISSHGRLLSKHFSLQPFFPKDWVSLPFVESVGHWGNLFEIWVSRSLEKAFPIHFLTSKHTLFIADKHHFPREYYGLVLKYTKSYHPNRCIKVGNKPPRLPCW